MKGDVPRSKYGMIDLPVGTNVKLQGKHCIVERCDAINGCMYCVLCGVHARDNNEKCYKIACKKYERADATEVYFKEIIE